ncbi:hypothetical protein ACJZL3_04860 [Wolbachia endosymbiont of Rhagoletis cingulata]|uniref:hypothetical protein n=1 Tax=Wolbachia endosymbiont of Rhagoletis cingulata TaxID=1220542 RepID=UPI003AF3A4AA
MQKRSYICENKQRKNKVIKIEGLNYFNKLRQNSSYVDMDKIGNDQIYAQGKLK